MSSDYQSITNNVFTSKSSVLKDILSTLFLDIHYSIAKSIELRDVIYIEDLKGFPEEMDLGKVTKAYSTNFFQIKSLNDCINKKDTQFSVSNIYSYIESTSVSRNQELKKRLKNRLEKKYTLKEFDHFSNISSQILRWRNIWAHEGGFQNISQAMVLQANISLLLKTYPDDLNKKIKGYNNYVEFIDNDFFNSISHFDQSFEEEDIDLEIKRHLDLATSESLSSDFNELSENVNSQISGINENNTSISLKVENLTTQNIKTNSLIEELLEGMNHLSVTVDKLKNGALQDSNSDILSNSDVDSDLPIVEFNDNLEIDDVEFLKHESEEKILTSAEIKDKLIAQRAIIKKEMKSNNPNFQNWHNILMRPLIEELVSNRFADLREFKDSLIFRHYYNCQSLRGKKSFENEKKNTQKMMDFQLKKYWDEIEKVLK